MFEKIVRRYYTFFDETLESTTFVVLFITLIIFVVGYFMPTSFASGGYSANILAYSSQESGDNTVMIDGVEYEIHFTRLK